MESAPDNALDYSDSRLASTFATRVYMYAKVLINGVKKGQLFFTVSHQKCRLVLTVKKFQGISNLALFSISADLHGPLAPEQSPNRKTSSHVLKTRLQDITTP